MYPCTIERKHVCQSPLQAVALFACGSFTALPLPFPTLFPAPVAHQSALLCNSASLLYFRTEPLHHALPTCLQVTASAPLPPTRAAHGVHAAVSTQPVIHHCFSLPELQLSPHPPPRLPATPQAGALHYASLVRPQVTPRPPLPPFEATP